MSEWGWLAIIIIRQYCIIVLESNYESKCHRASHSTEQAAVISSCHPKHGVAAHPTTTTTVHPHQLTRQQANKQDGTYIIHTIISISWYYKIDCPANSASSLASSTSSNIAGHSTIIATAWVCCLFLCGMTAHAGSNIAVVEGRTLFSCPIRRISAMHVERVLTAQGSHQTSVI